MKPMRMTVKTSTYTVAQLNPFNMKNSDDNGLQRYLATQFL